MMYNRIDHCHSLLISIIDESTRRRQACLEAVRMHDDDDGDDGDDYNDDDDDGDDDDGDWLVGWLVFLAT
ncbi:hypothetical protein AC249_AIPGENE20579 [Exaiptasia diaphana]|nr:hypothetical protein AC249_AIPGENE20579 [Exaiptasia diaphana]